MRRLARQTLNALTVLSLLLCVVVALLWVRSYYVLDVWPQTPRPKPPAGATAYAEAVYASNHGYFGPAVSVVVTRAGRRECFSFDASHAHAYSHLFTGACALPAAAVAMQWAAQRRKPRRAATNRCAHCSYDLTANVSGVCPECGTAIVRGNA